MRRRRSSPQWVSVSSAFAGYRFPPEVILLAVRWYLRYGLSCRDVEELLAERGIEVDHVTLSRWVERFTPLLVDAARPCRHRAGDRWFVDETYVKVAGRWRYVYRAVDQHGQVIDVFVSRRRDTVAATPILRDRDRWPRPTRRGHYRPGLVPSLCHRRAPSGAAHETAQYANNRIEADHGRLKARLRPMRGLKHDRTARTIITGHAFIQNLRRGHYELGLHARTRHLRLAATFDELAQAI